MTTEAVCRRISSLPLFINLGKTAAGARQISGWDDWAGPERPLVEEIHLRQQEIHDSVVATEEEGAWKESLNAAVALLSNAVPYDVNEDIWYGPNMAVWHAAWTFALETVHLNKAYRVHPKSRRKFIGSQAAIGLAP